MKRDHVLTVETGKAICLAENGDVGLSLVRVLAVDLALMGRGFGVERQPGNAE